MVMMVHILRYFLPAPHTTTTTTTTTTTHHHYHTPPPTTIPGIYVDMYVCMYGWMDVCVCVRLLYIYLYRRSRRPRSRAIPKISSESGDRAQVDAAAGESRGHPSITFLLIPSAVDCSCDSPGNLRGTRMGTQMCCSPRNYVVAFPSRAIAPSTSIHALLGALLVGDGSSAVSDAV